MTLNDAVEGKEYVVEEIATNDDEMSAFLFSLGCYSGEPITVVARKGEIWWFRSRTPDTTLILNWRKLF